MSGRTTWVFFAVALGLFAYIVLAEHESLTRAELALTDRQLFPRFVRNRVESIRIGRQQDTTLLSANFRDGVAEWVIAEPASMPADDAAVSALLGTIQYASARRHLVDVGEAQLAEFGLLQPRLRVQLVVGSEELDLAVGGDETTGNGVYVQSGRDVFVVGKDFYEAFDHDALYFRTATLLSPLWNAEELTVHGGGGERRFVKAGGVWSEQGILSGNAVEEALRGAIALEGDSFFWRDRTHIGDETSRVTVRSAGATETLTVYSSCAEGAHYVAASTDERTVACVRDSHMAWLRWIGAAGHTDLTERRLFPFSMRDWSKIVVLRGHARTEWTQDGDDVRAQGNAVEGGAAESLWSRLSTLVAVETREAATPPTPTMRIEATVAGRVLNTNLFETADGWLAQRDGEHVVLRFESDLATLEHAFSGATQRRISWERLVGLKVSEGPRLREELQLQRGVWMVTSPIQTRADPARLQAVVESLNTVSWSSASASVPQVGDTEWALVLREEDGVESVFTVQRMGGHAVLKGTGRPGQSAVVPAAIADLLDSCLATTDLRVSLTELDSLEVIAAGRPPSVLHWNGSAFAEIDSARSQALAEQLSQLRAVRALRYNDATPPERVQLTLASGRERAVWVMGDEGSAGTVLLRVGPVLYEISRSSSDAILRSLSLN